jgi:hypothetical protein
MAQTTIVRVRGTIVAVEGGSMKLTLRSGEAAVLKLSDKLGVNVIFPIAVEAIKPGSYIGTAAVNQPDGSVKALEIQVFPESMRGIGEGNRPWDLGPDTSMTNGTVGDLKVANGRDLTLTYKGGEKKVFVPEGVPIITYEPGSAASLVPGAHIIVFAEQAADGSLTALRASVGKDGLVPPM